MDMSAAFLKGATLYLPNALVSYDRFHIVALANDAMDEVRSAEWKTESARVLDELSELSPKERRAILWGMRRNPGSWSSVQLNAMHWLQRANLKSARAWRLKMALREVFAKARSHNQSELAAADLRAWLSWARRSPMNRTPLRGRHEARRALSTDGRFRRLQRTRTGRRWVTRCRALRQLCWRWVCCPSAPARQRRSNSAGLM